MKKLILLLFMIFISLAFINLASASRVAYWKFDETSGILAVDETGKYNGTLINSPTWDTGRYGNGLTFKGINQYVNISQVITETNGISTLTLEAWVLVNSIGGIKSIISQANGGGNRNWHLRLNEDKAEFGIYNETDVEISVQSVSSIPTNEWIHLAGVYNGTGVSIYINGTYENSVATSGNTDAVSGNSYAIIGSVDRGTAQFFNGTIDEVMVWDETRSELDIKKDAGISQININLIYPPDGLSTSFSTLDFISNISTSYYNLTNATLYVWNSTGIFNKTTQEISGDSNSTNITISGFKLGNYEWNILACGENDTGGFCLFAENYSFTIGANLESIEYSNDTYETSRETFIAEFSILENSEISLAQLVYNNINYTISNITYINPTLIRLTKSIDIPLLPPDLKSVMYDFFFRFTYAGDQVQETSLYQQNVSYINLQICNSTYSTTTLNFTFRDEFTNEELNASSNKTDIEVTFNYWIGSGNIYKNYSYINLSSENSQFKFCLYPSHITLKANMDMDYEADDYSPRSYYFRNATLTNQTTEINLVTLLIDYSVKFFVTLKQGLDFIDDAIVTVNKYFTGEGVYRTIGVRKTDDNGEFIEYFDIDNNYQFSVVKDGESLGVIDKWITCQEAPCTITLQLEDIETQIWEGFYDYFATDVSYLLDYDDDTKIVTFTFQDLTGLAKYFRLEVLQTKYNETSAVICNQSLYSTSGTITCNLTDYEGQFTANAYVSRSPEIFVDYIKFVRQTIKDVLGIMGIFITFLFVVAIGLVGAWNPAVGVALTAFALLMMMFLGFSAFSWATMIAIMVIALIIIMKMRN